MGRKSSANLPAGIHIDKHGVHWATLAGEEAKRWRDQHPGQTVPRRKAADVNVAIRLQRKLIRDLEQGRKPRPENPAIATLVARWIEVRDVNPRTAETYFKSLRWQIEPHRIGKLRLTQASRDEVQAWVDDLQKQTCQSDNTKRLSTYTVRNAFALLRATLNTAEVDKLIASNPCRLVKLPQPQDDEICPLNPEEVATLFKLLDTYHPATKKRPARPHRNRALYHVAIRCGFRKNEILSMRWRDLDLKRGSASVLTQLWKGDRVPLKTKLSRRSVPLTNDLVELLTWHKQNQAEEQSISVDGWNAAKLVFCSENGTYINQGNLSHQFHAMLRRAELPDIRFHDLRHTYASLAIAADVNLTVLSRRMGHSSIRVTADLYGHIYDGVHQDAAAIDALLERGE